jgi:hypothetical protein
MKAQPPALLVVLVLVLDFTFDFIALPARAFRHSP